MDAGETLKTKERIRNIPNELIPIWSIYFNRETVLMKETFLKHKQMNVLHSRALKQKYLREHSETS